MSPIEKNSNTVLKNKIQFDGKSTRESLLFLWALKYCSVNFDLLLILLKYNVEESFLQRL